MKAILKRQLSISRLQRLIAIVVVSLIIISSSGCAGKALSSAKAIVQSPAENSYQQGLVLMESDLPAAIAAFNQALELDPDYMPAYIELSMAYFALRMDAEGISTLTKAIAVDPTYARAYFDRANAYDRQGNKEAFIRDLDTSISLDSEYFQALAVRGIHYAQIGELEKAISDLDRAVVRPDYAEAYVVRGDFLIQLVMNEEDGAAYLDKALELEPDNFDGLVIRAGLYLQRGKLDKAERDLSQAATQITADLDPYRAYHFHVSKGHLLLLQGKITEAVAALESAYAIAPGLNPDEASNLKRLLMPLRDTLDKLDRNSAEYTQLADITDRIYHYGAVDWGPAK